MDLWVLDENLDAVNILDTYKSLIWTDRFYEYGDFEITMPMNMTILDTVKQDRYLWRKDSEHVMIIEKILIEEDAEDGDVLTITGRSLESILDRRVIWGLKNLSGNLQNGIEELLNDCIIDPSKLERKIDNFIFEETADPSITALTIEAQYTGDNLYDVVKALCEERGVGFRVRLNDQKQFVFSLYSGADRSYDQFANPSVIFSPKFDNITDASYMESKSSFKNVTLVGGEGEGSARRYTAVGNTSGLERRELFTDARDISSDISEDITESFDFTQYTSQVFNNNSKTFVTNANFNSCMVDVSNFAGRTISISIPKYTDSTGAVSGFATILVDSSKKYVSTLQVWEKNSDTSDNGTLSTYEILLPDYAKYIYTSMYSQTAIDNNVYYGDLDDFNCQMVKLSNSEYIASLRQRGTEDLAENIEIISFEGEAESTIMFKYGIDFFIGDIVSVADKYGHSLKSRVIEVITSNNEDGSTSIYPTFTTIEGLDIDDDDPSGLLPEGFTRLSYIQSDGGQYIDTGFKPSHQTRVVMDIEPLNAGTCAYFGSRSSTASYTDAFVMWLLSALSLRSDYGSVNVSQPVANSVMRVTIDKNRNVTEWGDTIITNTASEFTGSYNLTLLTQNTGGTVDTRKMQAKLYSCQIYENDILVRDFVPCTNEDGTVGLYDIVDSTFYMNAGTGGFVAGE